MQLATWNVNSLGVRLPQVLDWLQTHPVDVLALQETKLTDDKFPAQAFADAGYQAAFFGQKTYNGVALLTRTPVTHVERNIPGFDDELARVITATVPWTLPGGPGSIRVVGAYFPNGQAPGSDKFAYKMRWLHALHDWLAGELIRHPALLLMGDFNITFDDADVWDPEGMREHIHCTTDERHHLQSLVNLGLHDSLRLFAPPEKSYTWWDYREFGFRRNRGLRIDHILITDTLRQAATTCVIDKAPRKNERPSDHTPVILTLKSE